MRAAIALLGQAEPGPRGRRIAVLGDMLELGPQSALLHRELAQAVTDHLVDLVFCSGPEMRNLWEALPSNRRGSYADQDSGALEPRVLEAVAGGDAVMVKGSLRFENGSDREGTATQVRGRCQRKTRRRVDIMLYWLSDYSDKLQFFNLFRYITWRTGGALMTAAVLVFIAGSPIIDWLRAAQGKGQPIRADGPQSHLKSKIGTPTMGGLMIIFAVTASTILWANPANPYVWIVLGVTLDFRRDRLLRRLSEGDQAAGLYEFFGKTAHHRRDRGCDPGVSCDLAARPARPCNVADLPVFQRPHHRHRAFSSSCSPPSSSSARVMR